MVPERSVEGYGAMVSRLPVGPAAFCSGSASGMFIGPANSPDTIGGALARHYFSVVREAHSVLAGDTHLQAVRMETTGRGSGQRFDSHDVAVGGDKHDPREEDPTKEMEAGCLEGQGGQDTTLRRNYESMDRFSLQAAGLPEMQTVPKTSLLAPLDKEGESSLVMSDVLSDRAGDESADGRCRQQRAILTEKMGNAHEVWYGGHKPLDVMSNLGLNNYVPAAPDGVGIAKRDADCIRENMDRVRASLGHLRQFGFFDGRA